MSQMNFDEIQEAIDRDNRERFQNYLEKLEDTEYDKYASQVISKTSETNLEELEIVDIINGIPYKRLVKANTSTENSRLLDRQLMDVKERFILDEILPAGQIHILSGPSGVGKTRWLTPFIRDWYQGKDILGYKSHPEPYLYISCDRSGKSLNQTLKKLGLKDFDLYYKTIADIQAEFKIEDYNKMNLEDLIRYYPKIKVFFIEAIGWFQQLGNRVNQYAENLRYWVNVQQMVEKYDVTIIGTIHCPKSKPNEKHDNPRERVIGSVAMGAIVDSIFLLEFDDVKDVENKSRILRVMPRNAPASITRYRMAEGGILVEMSEDEIKALDMHDKQIENHKKVVRVKSTLIVMDTLLLTKKTELTTHEIEQYAELNDISRASAHRWIDEKVTIGELIKTSRGVFLKGRIT